VDARGEAGAALTTTGRAGTVRRRGSGKQDETPYERNQCLKPRNPRTGSNLTDTGRVAAHAATRTPRAATPEPVTVPGEEATLNACGVGVAMLPGQSWAARSSTGEW